MHPTLDVFDGLLRLLALIVDLRVRQRKLRVRRFTSRTRYESHQLLQEKRWWGWKTIDREDIPSHALISLASFGDTGGWTSRFISRGHWGKDGIVVPHLVAA